ncbi:MAG: HIT family protein [archaeon]
MRELINEKDRILYEDRMAVAVLPKKAVTKGHIIIFPKKETRVIDELSEDESEHLFYLASYTATVLFETLGAHGTNMITHEGEEFYIEVIARNENDGLNLQWEPSQVSSEELEEATKSISSRMILEEKVEADNPPKIPDQPEDKMSDDENNYMIKQLTRIP